MTRWTRPDSQQYDLPVDRSPGPVARHVRPPATIRGVLAAGFFIVFALWAFSGYELVRSLTQLERRAEETRDSFVRGERVLSTIRTSVLLGSIYLRDALVDTGPIIREYYRDELHQIRQDIEQRLPAYAQGVHSTLERKEWALLQAELADYWSSMDVVFGPDMPRTSVAAAAFLRERIVPQRDTILRILDKLAALRTVAERRHDLETSIVHEEIRQWLVNMGALSLFIGLIVAVVATYHVGRLETEIDRQRAVYVQNRRDLERLSARLVSAQEEERRSIARELHDEVGQALTAMKMELGVAQRHVEPGSRAAASLAEARGIGESALQSVRDLSQLLHPSMLDDLGLPDTIDTYMRGFSKRTGIRAQLALERMDERLAPEIEVGVYRIVQEALTNVLKHAEATACTVRLVRRDQTLQLTIEDDGRGIGSGPGGSGLVRRGLGVIGMRERAAGLGGAFAIGNREEGGTRVVVRLPLQPAGVVAFPAAGRAAV